MLVLVQLSVTSATVQSQICSPVDATPEQSNKSQHNAKQQAQAVCSDCPLAARASSWLQISSMYPPAWPCRHLVRPGYREMAAGVATTRHFPSGLELREQPHSGSEHSENVLKSTARSISNSMWVRETLESNCLTIDSACDMHLNVFDVIQSRREASVGACAAPAEKICLPSTGGVLRGKVSPEHFSQLRQANRRNVFYRYDIV